MTDAACKLCLGEGWLCEKHEGKPFLHGKCQAPGDPCDCNPDAKMPPGSTVIWTLQDGYAN